MLTPLFFNENLEVLVELRTNDSKWGLPGGWTDMGESPQTCIIRELKEETGFDIENNESVRYLLAERR